MLRGHSSRFMQIYARNGARKISACIAALRSKEIDLPMPSECYIARKSKGDEFISKFSGPSPLLDFSLNQDRIARLAGYLEALRSKKQYWHAVDDMEEKIVEQDVESEDEDIGDLGTENYVLPEELPYVGSEDEDIGDLETENYVLPEVLPFPADPCYLDDLIRLNALRNMTLNTPAVKSVHSMGSHDNADLILCVMRDLLFELWGLHYYGVIHGNLKPQNVLVFEGECMLTSIINDRSESLERQAPEQICRKTQTKASDMFTFGCVLYFCITGGYHPYGNTRDQCIHNIVVNKMNISRVEDIPDAYDLISLLLSPEPESRPKASDVFCHPFFEDLERKVQLVCDICSDLPNNDDIKELESKTPILRDPKWLSKFLDYASIYYDCPKQPFEDFKDVFGPRGSATFFPSIILSVFKVACKRCRHYQCFEEWRFAEDRFANLDAAGYSWFVR